jgi:hypothetical protein
MVVVVVDGGTVVVDVVVVGGGGFGRVTGVCTGRCFGTVVTVFGAGTVVEVVLVVVVLVDVEVVDVEVVVVTRGCFGREASFAATTTGG